eukprot:GHVP01056326.1.p1 GENE.GHVP01056326.1~~GHVP01056326.1.p1  ORF type:complete len:103 (+),score=17.45 GHVP01056326.1:22-330(+)
MRKGPAAQASFPTEMRKEGYIETPDVPISLEELQKHSTPEDGWTVINGKVYNLTPYLKSHPGGRSTLVDNALGKDDCAKMSNLKSKMIYLMSKMINLMSKMI